QLLAPQHGIRINCKHHLSNYTYNKSDDPEMKSIIEKSWLQTRVYVIIADRDLTLDFIRTMYRMGYSTRDPYQVITLDYNNVYYPNGPSNQSFFYKWVDFHHLDLEHATEEQWRDYVEPFRHVLEITKLYPVDDGLDGDFGLNVKNRSVEAPFCVPYHRMLMNENEVPLTATYAYDAVSVYAKALAKVLQDFGEEGASNGTLVMKYVFNSTYESVMGLETHIDNSGDTEGNYVLLALRLQGRNFMDAEMTPVASFNYTGLESSGDSLPRVQFIGSGRIDWPHGVIPLSDPVCGYDGSRCLQTDWASPIVGSTIALFLLIVSALGVRYYFKEHGLEMQLWKVCPKDLEEVREFRHNQSCSSLSDPQSISRGSDSGAPGSPLGRKAHVRVYKRQRVYLKMICKEKVDLTQEIRRELVTLRQIRHENLVFFVGAVVEPGFVAVLTPYFPRGNLEDFIKCGTHFLDQTIFESLTFDLLQGMNYLHYSDIVSHGNLHPRNCLIDSRCVLQISDFGLHMFKATSVRLDPTDPQIVFRAPEFLKNLALPSPRGTQKGDVYSFAMVLYAMTTRKRPWANSSFSLSEIIARVISLDNFRPPIQDIPVPFSADHVVRAIRDSWSDNPEDRPDFKYLLRKFQEKSSRNPNIFDHVMELLSQYTERLEDQVKEKTKQLIMEQKRTEEEKRKTENLLYNMMPKTVAEDLIQGKAVAHSFTSVTIYFSDIVGFTELAARMKPEEVVSMLNGLYSLFDTVIETSYPGVYKVETIGDAYMVASGCPQVREASEHASEIAFLALHLLETTKDFDIPGRPSTEKLKLRIGIHSGPVCAGVVGRKMPRYCLFGDTVNTASRMESAGEEERIHVSAATRDLLESKGLFAIKERGDVFIKGKGVMRTYWLEGVKNPLNGWTPLIPSESDTTKTSPQKETLMDARMMNPTAFLVRRSATLNPASSNCGPSRIMNLYSWKNDDLRPIPASPPEANGTIPGILGRFDLLRLHPE
ncbi:unnamed protein product, partial [Cyprideis torosa]